MKKLVLILLTVTISMVVINTPIKADEIPLVCPSSTLCAQRLNSCLQTALGAGGDLEAAAAKCFAQYEVCTSPEWCLPVY